MNFKFSLLGALALWVQVVQAQTTAFTYQGQLASGGAVVTGNFDLRFRLFDINTNLVAGPLTNAPVGVTNGLFLTTVDFGATNFPGAARFLEIGVRTNGNTNAYNVLTPYQPVNSTPYAIQSLNAANAARLSQALPATNISGTLPISVLSTNVALLTSNQVFSASNTFNGVLTANNPANAFTGNGAGLTGIPAPSLAGTLPDTTLSPNVPLLSINNQFLKNITAVQFNGSGYGLTNVPGAFFWLTVNGTTAQASSNLGFIVNNNTTPVTINLPPNPGVGDTFKVAGVGAAGWILTQNAGQQILAGNLATSVGQNWVQRAGPGFGNWTGVASSADGSHLIASLSSATGARLYVSANSGASWLPTAAANGATYWSSVASSADGSHLLATIGDNAGHSGYIYYSVNSGSSWASNTVSEPWIASAISADGTRMFVASYNGFIYESVNSGASWSQYTSGTIAFSGLACSADGTKLVSCSTGGNGGYIYVSGAGTPAGGLQKWSAVASSADGSNLVATVTGGGIYTSANGGATWNQQNQPNLVAWKAVASSSDGSRLAAAYSGSPGYVLTSASSGYTWTTSGATNAQWTAVACSADGSKLVAAASDGNLWTSAQGATTTTGTNGYLVGGYLSALELQYVGNGLFLPLNHEGTIRAY